MKLLRLSRSPIHPAAPPSEPRLCSPLLFLLSLLAVLLGALIPTAMQAQGGIGDLLVTPTRVVFEGRQRTAEITLVNVGSAAATYRITFVHLRMGDDGGMKEIDASAAAPEERFADELIRYSPRQVTLEPNVAQTVRLQLRKPAGLEAGEYRSHLQFRTVPPAEPAARPPDSSTELRVKLTAVFGLSLPIIVRQAATSATATLSDLELLPPAGAETAPTLRFRIGRAGNESVYGNFTVTFVPAGGKASVVGLMNGVAVYTPNLVRIARIALQPRAGVVLRNGLLRLAYTQQPSATIAAAELHVP